MSRWMLGTLALCLTLATTSAALAQTPPKTWTADNGNGTYTNPLFYDEFSDPDLIRVGDDFYLTGTTMHSMPGLPILHSKDLVNWDFVAYASPKLDLGPAFRLEDGKSVYGRGIWAPSFRYHNGVFYIFSNVNGQTTQLFTATNPAGPWTHTAMKRSFHDLSVLFDDDGKVYVVWGYNEVHLAQLNADLSDIVPGSEKIIVQRGSGMGEGNHFYKIDGKYYILSAWWDGRMRMPAARADHPDGPWEVNPAISIDEDFGLNEGNRLVNEKAHPLVVKPANTTPAGRVSLHQGGIVETPAGEWWGWSMMDYNSVGRLTALSPVTWKDGWPYFGLPGNLGRTPRTWVKPKGLPVSAPHAPYQRSDDFSGPNLLPVWQWNHVEDDSHWSLSERPGYLRLHSLPATTLWDAKNTLTQRAIGPQSTVTAALDLDGLKPGDIAGLALSLKPYAWIGVEQTTGGRDLALFDDMTGTYTRVPLSAGRIWLRADCDYITEKAQFSYSTDGKTFTPIGAPWTMVYSGLTFQGVRYSLFNYNVSGAPGGYADFDSVDVFEPHPDGLIHPIPYGHIIQLAGVKAPPLSGRFTVVDQKLGRVVLRQGTDYLTVGKDGKVKLAKAAPKAPMTAAQTFQWIETPNGDLVLMSLQTNRFLRIDPQSGAVSADSPGPKSDNSDGSRFTWVFAR